MVVVVYVCVCVGGVFKWIYVFTCVWGGGGRRGLHCKVLLAFALMKTALFSHNSSDRQR